MFFGKVATKDALGGILAHSMSLSDRVLKKGIWLEASDIAALEDAGVDQVVIARLDAGDVDENEAARRLGEALARGGVEARAPFAGRINLFAKASGLIDFDVARLQDLNLVNEAIAVSFLRPLSRVLEGQMIGTIKIIPYGIERRILDEALKVAEDCGVGVLPFDKRRASLILTRLEGMKESLIAKGERAVRSRLAPMGLEIGEVQLVAHEEEALSAALAAAREDFVLILTASATSDRADVAPWSVVQAGGKIERFGIPLDPGNLLFLGRLGEKCVVGLPGCVRSPVLNGADLVIERLMVGLELKGEDFARMGAGGFLKEAVMRPQPRLQSDADEGRGFAVVVLAAGVSSRMRGADKLLEKVGGVPLLRRLLDEGHKSQADGVYVVLPKAGFEARREWVRGENVIENAQSDEGMAASIRVAVQALAQEYEGIIFVLGDMPEIDAGHLDRLIAAYSAADGREIVRAASRDGVAGHPVLFGRRFFEPLLQIEGDAGAKGLIGSAREFLEIVRFEDDAPIVDLDTREAWENWRRGRGLLDDDG